MHVPNVLHWSRIRSHIGEKLSEAEIEMLNDNDYLLTLIMTVNEETLKILSKARFCSEQILLCLCEKFGFLCNKNITLEIYRQLNKRFIKSADKLNRLIELCGI